MKGTEPRQGRVVVQGLVFDWCRNSADQLEIWQWQCGRKTSKANYGSAEVTARALAHELIAGYDERLVSAPSRQPPMSTNQPATSSRPRSALRVFEIGFLTLGLGLVGFYAVAQGHSALGKKAALGAFFEAREKTSVARGIIDRGDHVETDRALWSSGRVVAYEESLSVSAETPQAVLRIKSIDLTAPIFEGTSELVLNRGLGHIEGTATLDSGGNMGIAGHRDGHLRGLKDVRVNDTIELWTLDETRKYRILDLKVVDPTDVYVLDPTDEPTITLVTCYPFYFLGSAPHRYIVRAVLEDAATVSRTPRLNPQKENKNVST